MPRLRQVPRSEADPVALGMYDRLFPDRDPVSQPGTSTGTPGNWWTVFALVPDCLRHAIDGFRFYRDPGRLLAVTQGGIENAYLAWRLNHRC